METKVHEIADGVYRLSTAVDEVPPQGFTFNQFLVDGEEPLLFHTGPRQLFPLVSNATSRVMPVERLRWIAFGHFEADECGAMNDWLTAAPRSTVVANPLACELSLTDQAARPPRTMDDGECLDIGGKRLRMLQTPHVPHGWDAALLFEEETRTLLAGDLFTQIGDPSPVREDDLVEPALETEELFGYTAPTPLYGPTVRRLAELQPTTVACMHGSSYRGNGATALRALADAYEGRFVPEAPAEPEH